MDEAVIKYYKRLLKDGFDNAGSLENPSIFLDSGAEHIYICGQGGSEYLNIFIVVRDNVIENIKYLCTCNPTVNVVIEILCNLFKNKTLAQARILNEKDFAQVLGSPQEEFMKKSREVLELVNLGIRRFEKQLESNK